MGSVQDDRESELFRRIVLLLSLCCFVCQTPVLTGTGFEVPYMYPLSADTSLGCYEECQNDPSCLAVNIKPRKENNKRKCYGGAVDDLIAIQGNLTLRLPSKALFMRTEYTGQVLREDDSVKTWYTCLRMCNEEETCIGWTFTVPKRCKLFSGVDYATQGDDTNSWEPRSISGGKIGPRAPYIVSSKLGVLEQKAELLGTHECSACQK